MPTTNNDGHWKYMITRWFPQFLQFFMPELYKLIDFTKPPIFLEKELDKIIKDDSKKGDKRCDKLVKVFLKNGEERWILIHIEIQHGYDKDFAKRMFIYYSRIFDQYGQAISALAVFTSDALPPKPIDRYVTKMAGTELTYKYNVYKAKKYKTPFEEQMLINNDNPFALVILSCIYMMKTKVYDYEKDTSKEKSKIRQRLKFKLNLIERLSKRGYDIETIRDLFTFIRYIVALPKSMEVEFEKTILETYAKTEKMDNLLTQADIDFIKRLAITSGVLEEEKKKAVEKAVGKAVEETTQQFELEKIKTILNLYTAAKFTIHQIAVIVQREEVYTLKVLQENGFDIS